MNVFVVLYGVFAGVVERSNTTDCKSVGIRLRRFESYPQYQVKRLIVWGVLLFISVILQFICLQTHLIGCVVSFSQYTITGRGIAQWQSVVEVLPPDVGKRLSECFRPEVDYAGQNFLLLKEHGYYWMHTYSNGYLTIIVLPAPPDHPSGVGEREALEILLDTEKLEELLVICA